MKNLSSRFISEMLPFWLGRKKQTAFKTTAEPIAQPTRSPIDTQTRQQPAYRPKPEPTDRASNM